MFFAAIREAMMQRKINRERASNTLKYFQRGEYQECADFVLIDCPVEVRTTFLLSLALKALYKLRQYSEVVQCADELISLDNTCEEAYFVQACSLAQLQKYKGKSVVSSSCGGDG